MIWIPRFSASVRDSDVTRSELRPKVSLFICIAHIFLTIAIVEHQVEL